ncbi:MAG: sulfur carrier protein ThiS [Candidatus Omnitrophota bacterium]
MVKIRLNGEEKKIEEGLTVKALLDSLNVNPYTVVVERNETVVRRAEIDKTAIVEGDQIEIVRFVGGG